MAGRADPVVLGRSPGTTRKGKPTSAEADGPNRSVESSAAAGDGEGEGDGAGEGEGKGGRAVGTDVTTERRLGGGDGVGNRSGRAMGDG